MNLDFIILGGYGQFVWPAFIFTFLCYFLLYLKTKKDLVKNEKTFLNTSQQSYAVKNAANKRKQVLKEVFSNNVSF